MKKSLLLSITALLSSFLFHTAAATVRYVNAANTNPVSPYTSWATAATNIQDATALAVFGDTVLVTNGIYQYGGASFDGSNRVRVAGALLKSMNGPAVTTIVGYQVPGTTNGSSAVRCVYLSEFSSLLGFTLTNGATPTGGFGGGVVTESSCTVSNCIIVNNAAPYEGGGCYLAPGSVVMNSWIAGNYAPAGGGAYGSTYGMLVNCVVTNNSAGTGSGVAFCNVYGSLLAGNGQRAGASGSAAYISTLVNCTIAGNTSSGLGAADGCTLVNSIIYYNNNGFYADCYQCQLTNCCTTLGPGTSSLSNGSISNAPGFVNPSGDYHLNGWSRCIGAGNTNYVTRSTDLDGDPRIVNGAVDMGCYENPLPFQGIAHYVSLLSTNPTPPYTNWATAATIIQNAVTVAQPGDYVIVDDGVYTNGGILVDDTDTNQVALTNGITLASAGGAQAATILGGGQTRCAYVGTNAVLMGFTLANGNGGGGVGANGGGVWCATGGVVSNCFIVNNSGNLGGGIYGGAIYNSTITNNNYNQGAAAMTALYNCMVISNGWRTGAEYAGGLYEGTASNCMIVANRAYSGGAGVYRSTVYNSTIMANQSPGGQGAGAYQSQLYGCSVLTNLAGNTAGGAYLCFLTNCLVSGNHSTTGGANSCTNYYCTFSGNSGSDGGGVDGGYSYGCTFIGNFSINGGAGQNTTFYDCLIVSNFANNGGGAYNCTLYNCTVVGNTATNDGGGAYAAAGSVNDSIVYYNNAATGPNWYDVKFNYCCTTPAAVGGPSSSITNAPIFVNMAAGDFHEQTNSPTVNDGSNSYTDPPLVPLTITTDLDGNPRVVGGTVDMGAYEYQGSNYNLPIPIQWLAQYGLPADGSQDYAYSDSSGMNNWQKWIAGLVPFNSASVLAMISPAPTNNSSGITVTWQSVTNRTYFLQSSTNLTGQPAFWSIQSNIPGQAGTTSYTDTSATNSGPYFYRVGVQ